ncbi:MAG: redoxin domain-containing protein [Alphaproteobacteria bacterium]
MGDRLPNVELLLAGGGALRLPDDVAARFCVILFYRGYWCPISRRQLEAFETHAEKLRSLDAGIIAASADPAERAQDVAATVSFPVAYGVTREIAHAVGAWWDSGRGIVQPAEFVVGPDRTVLSATYSTGPIGHIEPSDVVSLVQLLAVRPYATA